MGKKSTSKEPAGTDTDEVVALSPIATISSSWAWTVIPYVMFKIVPEAGNLQ